MPAAIEPVTGTAVRPRNARPRAHSPTTHVLVIDDCVDVRTFLGVWLTDLGCEVTTADCGEAAFRAIARKVPDVIVLDVVLPGTNGFDICDRLKQDARTEEVPVVMISGLRHAENVRRAREVGATHYLAKPFDELELMFVIEGLRDR